MMPANGNISCDGNQTTGTTCTFNCIDGYSIRGSAERMCLATNKWSGNLTSCEILHCDELNVPENGLIILPCDTQYGAICNVQCFEGYYTNSSNAVQVCQLNNDSTLNWSDPPICNG